MYNINNTVYLTVPQPEMYRKITLEDLLSGVEYTSFDQLRIGSKGATKTFRFNGQNDIPKKMQERVNVDFMIAQLSQFNRTYEDLFKIRRELLYRKGYIPKKKGGWREINEPVERLKTAMILLQSILSSFMIADHHTAAYAYVSGRSTVDALKAHQRCNNYWFAKFDLHDFFGSTTFEFITKQFRKVYPFNYIMNLPHGRTELCKALSLCMLNGGLPQGSPISPWLTNVIMIPFDSELSRALRKFQMNGKTYNFCYTRYADDMDISCKYKFDYKVIESTIISLLDKLGASFQLNQDKTEFGSRAGSNYILGLKLNSKNEISIGYKQKFEFEAKLVNYALSHGPCGLGDRYDRSKTVPYTLHDVQKLNGLISYYKMVEPNRTKEIIAKCNAKLKVDIEKLIDFDLKNL